MTVHYCKNVTFKWKKGDGVGRGLKIILKRSFVKFKRFSHGWGEQIDKVLMLCVVDTEMDPEYRRRWQFWR